MNRKTSILTSAVMPRAATTVQLTVNASGMDGITGAVTKMGSVIQRTTAPK